ncbi:mannose/glucose-specific lectin-like [Cornus florida]|uniref:mannose/glucose-specific lectin-like n=1 Tax=Cornus florida TaxID=4283 RepID=UPI00289675CB|nr:mannose/glucose-specific lectin-like [Cornus florida]XP_059650948.1 mannose/glucose-specific lectin-like [Cornus florida]
MANGQMVKYGQFGRRELNWNLGSYDTIRGLTIYAKEAVFGMIIVHDDKGKPVSEKVPVPPSSQSGHDTKLKTAHTYKVELNYPTEYLVSISGCIGDLDGFFCVKSLTIHSNVRQYGPYGTEDGGRFMTPLTGVKIVGFFGRQGSYLDAIGVNIIPFQTKVPVGPFGTSGGQQWDDGTYSTVRELIIHSGMVIDCIQVVYDNEGKRILGEKHGTAGGQENKVTLAYPDEFLLSVWGYYGQVGDMVVIRSLGFQSNKRMIGPFGVESGEKFQSSSTCGKIIGFYGRSDKYLSSIGAYLDK